MVGEGSQDENMTTPSRQGEAGRGSRGTAPCLSVQRARELHGASAEALWGAGMEAAGHAL